MRFKSYVVDLDTTGDGLKGFRRFRSLKKAITYAKLKAGWVYKEFYDREPERIY